MSRTVKSNTACILCGRVYKGIRWDGYCSSCIAYHNLPDLRSRSVQAAGQEERIRLYRERVEAGLPIFGGEA